MNGDPMRPRAAPKAREGFYNLDALRLEGFDAQIQRGGAMGTDKRGLLGMGTIIGPDGQPRVVVQMKHPDGESLSSIMDKEDFMIFASIFVDTNREAVRLEAAGNATNDGKPS